MARAIRSGIFNDLGSGSNVDVVVITKEGTETMRNYEMPVSGSQHAVASADNFRTSEDSSRETTSSVGVPPRGQSSRSGISLCRRMSSTLPLRSKHRRASRRASRPWTRELRDLMHVN